MLQCWSTASTGVAPLPYSPVSIPLPPIDMLALTYQSPGWRISSDASPANALIAANFCCQSVPMQPASATVRPRARIGIEHVARELLGVGEERIEFLAAD